jgi:hypothetical protein
MCCLGVHQSIDLPQSSGVVEPIHYVLQGYCSTIRYDIYTGTKSTTNYRYALETWYEESTDDTGAGPLLVSNQHLVKMTQYSLCDNLVVALPIAFAMSIEEEAEDVSHVQLSQI